MPFEGSYSFCISFARSAVDSLLMSQAEESVMAAPKPWIFWYLTLSSTLMVSGLLALFVRNSTSLWPTTHFLADMSVSQTCTEELREEVAAEALPETWVQAAATPMAVVRN
ncbi:hypothetical protein ABZT02_04850 [Streptomyces sp. NPDC005402]|uniref:hypothetical protein n=1 Tax=Streptomyces sp. NPDC005402 TaxID=3155338 RepID=UPI0033AE4567